MTADPFEQLRLTDEPAAPDARFVAALRRRLVAALDAADAPTIALAERNTTMSDAPTTSTASASPGTAPAGGAPATSRLVPYLCATPAADAIAWYVDVFDAVEQIRYVGDDGRVGHAELSIGGASFMLSDEYPEIGVLSPTTIGATPFAMHLSVPDVDGVHERVVADGRGTVGRPPHEEAHGARSFDLVDPFGHRWMIQTPTSTPSIDEIEQGMSGYSITVPDGATAAPAESDRPPVEIGYVTMAAPDTARAVRFYGALFGWASERGNLGDDYAHVNNTALPMGLTPGAADEAPVLYFRVDDLAAYATRVRQLGGEVLDEATYESGPNATCRDDQGRQFQLWQPAPGYE